MKSLNKSSIVTALIFVTFALGLSGPIVALAAGPAVVDLGSAGNFVILGKSAITTTGATAITGDVGLSPAAASFIAGFGLVMDSSNAFSTSALVTGKIYAANYTPPTPAYMTTAITDMEAAYVNAAGRTSPTATNVAAGIIGGQTFTPGLYKWTTDVSIAASGATSTDVTISGGASDVWIFQIAGDLNVASGGSLPLGAKIILTGGAQASNIFWQVGGPIGATLGTYSTFKGTILSAKQVILQTGAVLNGRALAQTQVTLDANTVSTTGSTPATLRVIKLVVNTSGGTAVTSAFNVHVKNASGTDVGGSPLPGASAPGNSYTLAAGTYVISEDANALYTSAFSGTACDSDGNVTLAGGDDKTCTVLNTNIAPPSSSGGGIPERIAPLIGIVKVPSPLALPGGSGPVTYNYTVRNVGGVQALTSITVIDDKCSPILLLSGDTNSNGKLDPTENWKYSCTTPLAKTTTNTAIATGYSDGPYHEIAIDTAIATVVVGAAIPPPLIDIVKVPSRLTPFPVGGGDVTYTYTVTNPGVVALHNVAVTDDKCAPVYRTTGDANSNNLLDTNETWTYICQSHVSASTRNIATVEGKANGFTALGYTFATVLVSAPSLPNTGLTPQEGTTVRNIVVLSSILLLVSISLVVSRKKRTI